MFRSKAPEDTQTASVERAQIASERTDVPVNHFGPDFDKAVRTARRSLVVQAKVATPEGQEARIIVRSVDSAGIVHFRPFEQGYVERVSTQPLAHGAQVIPEGTLVASVDLDGEVALLV